jgi:Tetratricopeptide repeat
LGSDHPDTTTCLNNLAALYKRQGRYKEAEPLHQRAMKISIAFLGVNHPQTQQIIKNLSTLSLDINANREVEALINLSIQREQNANVNREVA